MKTNNIYIIVDLNISQIICQQPIYCGSATWRRESQRGSSWRRPSPTPHRGADPCCLPGSPGNRALGLQLPTLTPSSRWCLAGAAIGPGLGATQAIHVHRRDTCGLRQLPRVPRQRRAPVRRQAMLAHRRSGKRKDSRIGIFCYTCMVPFVRPARWHGEQQTYTFRVWRTTIVKIVFEDVSSNLFIQSVISFSILIFTL